MIFLVIVLMVMAFILGLIIGMHKQREEDVKEFKQTQDNNIKFGGF